MDRRRIDRQGYRMADQNSDKNHDSKPQNDPKGPKPQGNGNKPPQNMMGRGMFGWMMLIGLMVLMLFVLTYQENRAKEISAAEFVAYAQAGAFKDNKVIVENERMRGELKDSTAGVPEGMEPPYRVQAQISRETKAVWVAKLSRIEDPKIDTAENPGSSLLWNFILMWAPFLLLAFLVYFFFIRSMRNAGGGMGMLNSFGRSRHKVTSKEHSTITLADVAGIDEAKDEVVEIIEFLKNPKRFQRLGGRVPRGVLLIGQPGCGKTLLAKAVAGEAEVPFFSISGSDFVEMFVGVGASRVRDLFKQAKETSPCIIFLDEIDAVGRRRGSGFSSGGHDEREQTLNAILVEMDGFDTNDQVIVIAATNRADVLDQALTRPGRFDRQIHVPLPDIRGRLQILKVHARRIKMGPDVDIERIARGTPMFSGADLAAIINEAAIAATLQNKDFVEMEDLEEARDKVRFGRAYRSRKIEDTERVATAYHEAGHAVLQYLMPEADPLHKVTIIPRGQAMGATFSLPEKDRYGFGQKYIDATMRVLCGGRIAERRKTGDITSGAAMDIRMVTSYARHMILEWGMSEKLGFVDYTPTEERDAWATEKVYSEQTARVVDDEIKRMADEAYQEAQHILDEHWDQVVALAEALLKYETLSFDEVDRLMKGEKLNKSTISDLLEAEQQRDPESKPAQPTDDGEADTDTPGAMPSPA
jgi:cell division protease FtsH